MIRDRSSAEASVWLLVLALVPMATVGCGAPSGPEPADMVLVRGKLVTVDPDLPEAEALAVRSGRIVAVGSDEEIVEYVGSETTVLDVSGMLTVPGLIEGHGHFMRFGNVLTQLDLTQAESWDEVVDLVQSAVRRVAPGEWIEGWGWHQDKWDTPPTPSVEGLPTHGRLSEVSPDNPVFLSHISGHGVFVNASALEASGITRDSPNPPGGEIVRDGRGEPIGMLREDAATPARDALAAYLSRLSPEEADARNREHVRLAANETLANGITSFQDMGSTFESIDVLKTVADEGGLPIRLFVAIQEPATALEDRLSDYRMVGYADDYLTVRTIGEKVLDGALGTHGGWLLEPYTDLPRSVGFNVTPVDDIRRSAELAVENGFQMAIQGIGDRAVRELFDIYEEAWGESPTGDYRWRIEHAQVVHPDDLPRFAKLGVIPGIQGIFACSDGPWVVDRLGEERTRERGYVFRSMIESGAVVMNGTDPPVELIDPMASFHCSVTRQLADGSIFLPEQQMTREQALAAYTINNAYAAFEENIKGSLTPGKLADVTVLSRDIMTIPADEIRGTEVVYTIVGGEVRYERDIGGG